jgi:hypothetical protein
MDQSKVIAPLQQSRRTMKKLLLILALLVGLYQLLHWYSFRSVQASTAKCRQELRVAERSEQIKTEREQLLLAVELGGCAQARAGWLERNLFYRR